MSSELIDVNTILHQYSIDVWYDIYIDVWYIYDIYIDVWHIYWCMILHQYWCNID